MPNELFISKRIFKSDVQGKKVSSPIVRISVISISLAIVVNLITIAVVNGFQNEVRQKITGFGSHFFIRKHGVSNNFDAAPILKEQKRIEGLKKMEGIKSISPVAYKPAILQSRKIKRNVSLVTGKDSSFVKQDVQGVIFKGIDSTYNLDFFDKYLIKGDVTAFLSYSSISSVLISEKTAKTLSYKLGDTINVFFVKSKPIKQNFIIKGIYNSGLEEFDKKIVVAKLRDVQNLNDWGLNAEIKIADTLHNEELVIYSDVSGGDGNYLFNWGHGFQPYSAFSFYPDRDTLISLVVKDTPLNPEQLAQYDTTYLKIDFPNNNTTSYEVLTDQTGEIIKTFNDGKGYDYNVLISEDSFIRFIQDDYGVSNSEKYVSGFEVIIDSWDELDNMHKKLQKKIELIPSENNSLIEVVSIISNEKDLFLWLSFLDLNVLIIVILMLLIAIINIGSAMLVIIVVRTNFIGVLKSFGANNWSIRKIFLLQALFLMLRGIFFGNLIGLGLCYLQIKFEFFSLNPEVYYLNAVPIKLELSHWVMLNVGTIVICLLALLLPSYVVTKISPNRAIRFD